MGQYFFRHLAVDEETDGNILGEGINSRKEESVHRRYRRYIAYTPHLIYSA